MGRDKFKAGLEELGYIVEEKDSDKLIINYVIKEGRFDQRQIQLGIAVPADFEMTPPGGIHVSPHIIEKNPQAQDHSKAADSPFGAGWIYLSRPFNQWPLKRTVKRYMEYVAYLLNTL